MDTSQDKQNKDDSIITNIEGWVGGREGGRGGGVGSDTAIGVTEHLVKRIS